MSTGTTYKRLKRRFKKKLYHFLLAVNEFDFGKLRPLCYLLLLGSVLLAWAKLPTKETNNLSDKQTEVAAELASSIRTSMKAEDMPSVDIVALFLSEEDTADSLAASGKETLYSFYLTGNELSYLAEGAITTVSKENRLYLDGVNYTYHKNRLPFNRVTALTNGSGEEILTGQLYHIISTEDIFALFHYISYRSIGIMDIYPKDASGALLSDYQKVVFSTAGTPLTLQKAICKSSEVLAVNNHTSSVITMQYGFNLLDLIKEPNRITVCMIALFIAFFALLWYIVPRINRIRVWFRIYRIRSRKRSTHHTLYELKKRF